MINAQQLLHSLYGLRDQSFSSDKVDSAVDFIANKGRRISLTREIIMIENRLAAEKGSIKFKAISEDAFLVRSLKVSGRASQRIEEDHELFLSFTFSDNMEDLKKLDSENNRYLYHSEFTLRIQILKEHIIGGKLDSYLAVNPGGIVHQIMGFRGELLPVLWIDSSIGETYLRFLKRFELPDVKLIWAYAVTQFFKAINKSPINTTSPVNVVTGRFPVREERKLLGTDNSSDLQKVKDNKQMIPQTKHNKAIVLGMKNSSPVKPLNKAIVLKKRDSHNTHESHVDGEDPDKIVLGIEGETLTPEIAKNTELPVTTTGVLVLRVIVGSIADKAGLRGCGKTMKINGKDTRVGGDIITKVDGLELKTIEDLRLYIKQYYIDGQKISLRIIRDNSELDLTLG